MGSRRVDVVPRLECRGPFLDVLRGDRWNSRPRDGSSRYRRGHSKRHPKHVRIGGPDQGVDHAAVAAIRLCRSSVRCGHPDLPLSERGVRICRCRSAACESAALRAVMPMSGRVGAADISISWGGGHMPLVRRRFVLVPIALPAPAALGVLIALGRLELVPSVPSNDASPVLRHDALPAQLRGCSFSGAASRGSRDGAVRSLLRCRS